MSKSAAAFHAAFIFAAYYGENGPCGPGLPRPESSKMDTMRVLIVEDYDLLRDSIAQGLREAGFAVDAAADGEDGLACAIK